MQPADANEVGVLVGNNSQSGRAFMHLNGTTSFLDLSEAFAVNNQGVILGRSESSFTSYDIRTGRYTAVGPASNVNRLSDINDHGWMTGFGGPPNAESDFAWLTRLRAPAEGHGTLPPMGIDLLFPKLNNLGQMTGVSYQEGGIGHEAAVNMPSTPNSLAAGFTKVSLGRFHGSAHNLPTAINDQGLVVGFSFVHASSNDRLAAWYFDMSGSKGYEPIGESLYAVIPLAASNSGEVVGAFSSGVGNNNTAHHAFTFSASKGFVDLSANGPPNVTLTRAHTVTASGIIAGISVDRSGRSRGFVLRPRRGAVPL